MPLFQKSVEEKYLKLLDEKLVSDGYKKYKDYFHNAEIQKNILEANEEQYQSEFLIGLFADILGYTMSPHPSYNITTEFKNLTDSKKADGAILKDGKAIAVIELKGTYIKDLDKVTAQGFNYKNHQPSCSYVITSNFEKLRFYIDDAVQKIEFQLFTLTLDQFRLLWLCLHHDNIFSDLPARIKQESIQVEADITKQLYSDYSVFKKELWQDVVKNNQQFSKLLLYQKTQKLLDRFLFILFAEDKGLISPNSIRKEIDNWQQLKKLNAYIPLYERIKQYFTYLNIGASYNGEEIFAYNGGLFLPDEVIDTISVTDELLKKHLDILIHYDYSSEVDVNILGHIFEHSLSEMETLTAEVEGRSLEKEKTKRKKDGIFYTPKYITKHIVENTIGKLCDEKKTTIGIKEEEYAPVKKKADRKILNDKLEEYRKWLLTLTIIDPACGSGAFLNQALEFLIAEHGWIDELRAKLFGDKLLLTDIANSVLENNLYGVDINNESVEIAKLSLWLRTAKRGRKLSALNNNIKCGNSLVDDSSIAGEKAFSWKKEFSEVFENGGFDVVIGNPPYGASLDSQTKIFLTDSYKAFDKNQDIYSCFYEKAIQIIKERGLCAYITPVSWQTGEMYYDVRKCLKENTTITQAIKLPYDVFEDAYVDTGIYIFQKVKSENYVSLVYEYPVNYKKLNDLENTVQFKELPNTYWINTTSLNFILNPNYYLLNSKLNENAKVLNDVTKSIRGILPNEGSVSDSNNSGDSKKYFVGDVYRYETNDEFKWVTYGNNLKEKPNSYDWFIGDRLLIRRLINRRFRIMATYASEEFVNKKDLYVLKITDASFDIKFILALLNSSLFSFIKTASSTNATKDDFGQLTLSDIRNLPLKEISEVGQQNFVIKVDNILSQTKKLQSIQSEFLQLLSGKVGLEKPSTKLQVWYELELKGFLQELKKAKVELELADEAKWMNYFNEQKAKAQELVQEIKKADSDIDKMVYSLYDLSNDEIQMIESALK